MTSSDSPSPSTRWALVSAATLVGLVLIARVITSGYAALDEGARAETAGDHLRAVVAYREAVSWYLPGVAPWRGDAADALWSMAEREREAGRLPEAVRALQSLRAGLRSADSLWRPDDALKAKVDSELALLMAQWEAEDTRLAGRESPGNLEERRTHHAALLAKDERPSRGWGLLAVLGFLGWVSAALMAARREAASRRRLLVFSALGLLAFLTGVGLA